MGARHVLRPPLAVRATVAQLEEAMSIERILMIVLLIIVIVWAAQFLLGYG
jgi:hypothetical protein